MVDFGEGSCCSCPCCCCSCDRGKTKSTVSPKTEVWTLDWSLTISGYDFFFMSYYTHIMIPEMSTARPSRQIGSEPDGEYGGGGEEQQGGAGGAEGQPDLEVLLYIIYYNILFYIIY